MPNKNGPPAPAGAPEDPLPGLAARVKLCIEKMGGTAPLAAAAHVSEAQLYRYVAGESHLPAHKLAAIAQAAGVDAGWLLTGAHGPAGPIIPKRPEYNPKLLAHVAQTTGEVLLEYEHKLTPIQRARFTSFAYQALRHEEALRGVSIVPSRGQILEMLTYLGKETFDELLDLHEHAYHALELGEKADTLTPSWCEHFTNAVITGQTQKFSGPHGAAFYRRTGLLLSEQSRTRLLNVMEHTSRQLKPHKTLAWLDAGCGNGRELNFIAKHRPQDTYYGHDISPLARQELAKLIPVNSWQPAHFTTGDMRFIPWPAKHFDVVYSRMALHTLPHLAPNQGLADAFADLVRVLKPGGLLAITTARGTGRLYLPFTSYLSAETLTELGQKNGLTPLAQTTYELDNGTENLRSHIQIVWRKN